MSIEIDEITVVFIEESLEGLDTMENGLLNLNNGEADAETMNAIFRAAHSIKGGGATFGFNDISEFAHELETLLDQMRDGRRSVTTTSVDLMLQSVDCLRNMIQALSSGDTAARDQALHLKQALAAMVASDDGMNTGDEPAADVVDADESGWQIRFEPHREMLEHGSDPIMIINELRKLGDVTVTCSGIDNLDYKSLEPTQCYLSWDIVVHSPVTEEAVREPFGWVEDDCELVIEPLAVAAKPSPMAEKTAVTANTAANPGKPVVAAQRQSAAVESSSIRVNIEKIDDLINLVGELVITQSMLSRFNGDFDFSHVDHLRDGLAQLSRNTRELQESVMAIRMLPISFAFSRYPRLVRDASKALGKKVNLEVVGENTELDKTVLEKIGDPLVHLVRNSLDHGLETPEKRLAAGKPEAGVLTLSAFHEGGNIVIEVSDDGAGINQERVLAKARENGLVGPNEELSDERINNLIFMPGFSTAETVSDLSGRGVGMDVVRRNITDLGGSVSVKSVAGEGSTFTIRLPLTLAILDGQLVRVGEECYIIPLVSIVETIQVQSEHVSRVAGESELFRLRNQYLPVVRLHELFGINGAKDDIENGLLVVAEANGDRVGLLVDDLREQQQVVIKSLDTNFRQTPGISGATILGDGTVALIIDMQGLIQLFMQSSSGHVAVA